VKRTEKFDYADAPWHNRSPSPPWRFYFPCDQSDLRILWIP